MIEGEVVREKEGGFIFRSDGYDPGEWAFKVLTIQDFKREYFRNIVDGKVLAQTIKTTKDLHEWYRKDRGILEQAQISRGC
jgi:hypothetical protein